MADFIVSPGGAAGSNASPPVLTLSVTGVTGNLVIPSLKDATINASNDIYSWTQLDKAGKRQVPTTSTNSISTNLVVEEESFFGNAAATSGSALKSGIFGLSNDKTKLNFSMNLGDRTVSGVGYVTGIAPTVSADSPVWLTPVTITVDGDFTVV